MPWVLLGMGFAALVAVLAWNRAWSHRQRASLQAASWQAQLLAESALACAEDSVWAKLKTGTALVAKPDSAKTSLDSAVGSGGLEPASDSSADPCPLPPGARGTIAFEIGDGTLLVPVVAKGEVPFGRTTIARSIRASISGALDRVLFGAAVTQCTRGPSVLNVSGTRIVGDVRVRSEAQPPPGFRKLEDGITAASFVPMRAIQDTAAIASRLKTAFQGSDVFSGGAAYSSGRGFPDRTEIVHTSLGGKVEVDIEGPIGGTAWRPPAGRVLMVEGDVFVRGRVLLDGWTIMASGEISLEGDAKARDVTLYAQGGVSMAGDADFSGQILSGGRLEIAERSRLSGSVVAMCWGRDSGRISLAATVPSRGYLVALGSGAELRIGREAVLEGVAVSEGAMRVEGAVHGVAVAGSFRCRPGVEECTGTGTFDRTLLPADFVVPLGLPGAQGLRIASWEAGE